MALVLNTFPKLDQTLRTKSGYSPSSYDFYYINNEEKNELDSEKLTDISSINIKSTLKLSDSRGIWHPEEFDLSVQHVCSFRNPAVFFGENGIATGYSTLGVAVEWTAKDASVRGVFPVGELTTDETEPVRFSTKFGFEPHTLRGSLSLKTILYLKEYGGSKRGERHLAKIPGTVLGVLDETSVVIDGNGSVFPVVMVNNPGEPLWWAECSWGDPFEDSFTEENFCLKINQAHPVYKTMEGDEGLMKSPLFAEIMASTLQILITAVLSDKTCSLQDLQAKNIDAGCIAGVVVYLMNAFQWDVNLDEPDKLALQIRRDLDKRLGG